MIRLAMIGCSNDVTSYVHIAPRLTAGQFTAVADQDVRAAKGTAAALGAAVWCQDFKTLLSDHAEAFDAVVVRSCGAAVSAAAEQSGRAHRLAMCERAAAARKHILIDGPFAESAAEVQNLIAACGSVRLMVGHPLRFLPSVRAVKEACEAGRLGEPGLVRVHRWEPPNVGIAADAPATSGRLPDLMARMTGEIDLVCWLFGQRPNAIYAVGWAVPTNPTSGRLNSGEFSYEPDYLQLHLGFPGGGMALIDGTRMLPPGGAYFSLSLIGSSGAAYADDHHNMQLLFAGGPPSAIPTGQGDAALLAQLQEFVTAIEAGRDPLVTGADGLAALQIAEAAAVSLASGEAQRWAGERYADCS